MQHFFAIFYAKTNFCCKQMFVLQTNITFCSQICFGKLIFSCKQIFFCKLIFSCKQIFVCKQIWPDHQAGYQSTRRWRWWGCGFSGKMIFHDNHLTLADQHDQHLTLVDQPDHPRCVGRQYCHLPRHPCSTQRADTHWWGFKTTKIIIFTTIGNGS